MAIFLILFQKHRRGGNTSKLIYEASIVLIAKPDKDNTRQLQTDVPDEQRCKNPHQNINKLISIIITKVIGRDQVGSSPGMQRWFDSHKPTGVIRHINKTKDKNHRIVSIDAGKAFHKIQLPSTRRALGKVRTEGAHIDTAKAAQDEPSANITLDGEKRKAFPLRSGTRHGRPLPPLPPAAGPEVLGRAAGQEQEMKSTRTIEKK